MRVYMRVRYTYGWCREGVPRVVGGEAYSRVVLLLLLKAWEASMRRVLSPSKAWEASMRRVLSFL